MSAPPLLDISDASVIRGDRLALDSLSIRIDQGQHGILERLAHTHCHQQLTAWIIGHTIQVLKMSGKGFADLYRARIRCVGSFALLQRANTRRADDIRRHKIRLANPQRDNIIHRCSNIKKAPDT